MSVAYGNGIFVAVAYTGGVMSSVDIPLPVSLGNYTATAEHRSAKLQWQTTGERDNKGFVIYRGGDDGIFVKIGEVGKNAKEPNTLNLTPYTFIDKQPLNGNNYYKLVQLDNDGKPTELGIRSVAFHFPPSTFHFYPNPTKDKITVTFEEDKYHQILLSDNLGKVLQQLLIPKQVGDVELDLSAYAPGMYFITLTNATDQLVKKVAIAKGSNTLFTGLSTSTLDLAGNPRVYGYANNGTIDLGAYEYQGLLATVLSSFADRSKTYGDAGFSLTAPTSNGDGAFSYSSNDLNVATLSGNTLTIIGAGTATITATQAATGNYDAASISLVLTVAKANQTINFAALDPKAANSADFTLGATASSNLPVSYTSSNTAVAEVYESAGVWKVKVKTAGSTNITAQQAGDANYNAATNVIQALVVESVLPVELVSYTAKLEGNYTKLQWITTNERNNKGFVIYRSGDDGVFIKIGEVDKNAKEPNTLNLTLYTFIDKQPLNGNNYYKLVQLDNDGTATELGIKPLTYNLKLVTYHVFPNPTKDKLTVSFEPAKYTSLALSSVDGKVLRTVPLNQQQDSLTIDLSTYPTGVYLIRLIGTKESIVKKVVKH